MKGFSLPKIGIKTNGQFFVHFKVDGERFRFSNGKVIDSPHSPNRVEGEQRQLSAELLRSDFTSALGRGWKPERTIRIDKVKTIGETLEIALKEKLSVADSRVYRRDIKWTAGHFSDYIKTHKKTNKPITSLDAKVLLDFLQYSLRIQQHKETLQEGASSHSHALSPFVHCGCLQVDKTA